MNLIEVMERFPDQESCIDHLERIRWAGKPACPHCSSQNIRRKKEDGVGRVGRWNCKECNGFLQSHTWHSVSRNTDTASEVVSRNCLDTQC